MAIETKDETKKKTARRPVMKIFPRRTAGAEGTVDSELENVEIKTGSRESKEIAGEKVITVGADDGQLLKKVEVEKISDVQLKVFKSGSMYGSETDNLNRVYSTGKRKNAAARVWLSRGSGKMLINGRSAEDYLKRPILEVLVNMPFTVTGTQSQFDVKCSVRGGGLSGQAGAIRHAIARAMTLYNVEAYRKDLKSAGFLTRDPRIVERKKPGLKKARKGQVFSKR